MGFQDILGRKSEYPKTSIDLECEKSTEKSEGPGGFLTRAKS